MSIVDKVIYALDDGIRNKKTRAWPSWRYLLITVPWAIGLIWISVDHFRAVRAIPRQAVVQGIYTAYDLDNHHSCGYAFTVSGIRYENNEFGCREPLPALGSPIRIYYDKTNPSYNSTVDFEALAATDTGPVPLLVIGVFGLATAILISKYRQRATQSK